MKKLIAILLVMLLAAALIPVGAEPTRAQRTSLLDLSNATSSQSNSNEGWAFNPTGKNGKPLLTLTNYGSASAHSAPIKLPKNTTVHVEGECYIDNSVISSTIYDVIYAPVDGNLWFEGDGTLNLYAPNGDKNNGKCIFLNTGGTNANDEWLYIDDLTINCYSKEYQNPSNYCHPCISGGLCIEIRNATVRTYGGLRGIYTFGYGSAGATEEQQNHILIENSVIYIENQSTYLTNNNGGNGIFISGGRIMLINSDVTVYGDTGAVQCHNNTLLIDGGSVKVYSRPLGVSPKIPGIRVSAIKITENTDYFYVGTHDPRYIYLVGTSHDSYNVNISSELNVTIGSYTGTSIDYGLDPNRNNLPAFEVRKDAPVQPHTVTFVDWDGTVLSTQEVLDGGAAEAPAVPGREGYTFTGWDVDFTNVTSDLTVTAQYQIMTFTVTFLGRNGFVSEQTVEYGSAAAAPAVPDDGFWRFFAWDREFDCVTENITVNAIYGLKGDVNCDGVVDSADITLAAAYSMSAGEVTPLGVFNGDMNNDGILNAADLSALYGYIQG